MPQQFMSQQPDPIPNDNPSIHDLVIKEISYPPLVNLLKLRKIKGLETYKNPLQAFNGRDALWDAAEEVADLIVYLKQALIERNLSLFNLLKLRLLYFIVIRVIAPGLILIYRDKNDKKNS